MPHATSNRRWCNTQHPPLGGSACVYLLRWLVITNEGGACVPYRPENKKKIRKKSTVHCRALASFNFPSDFDAASRRNGERAAAITRTWDPPKERDRRVCRILPSLLTGIPDAGHVAFNTNNRKPSPHQSPPSFFFSPLSPGLAHSRKPALLSTREFPSRIRADHLQKNPFRL